MGGSRCIAPKCTVGYDSNKEKVHKFSVPKCPERRKKWERALKRDDIVLKAGQVVCQKHFLPEDIMWGWESKDVNGRVIKFEYKIPRLKDDAWPSQFPGCPKYMSQTRKRRKSPKKRDSSLLSRAPKIKKTLVFEEAERTVDSEETDVVPTHSQVAEVPIPCNNFETKSASDELNKVNKTEIIEACDTATSLFESMFKNHTLITCPLPWTQQNIWLDVGNKIQFVHWDSKLVNDKCRPVCHKQLVVSSDLSINFFVNGVSCETEKIGLKKSVSSPSELNIILYKLNTFKVCRGCADPSEDINFANSFTTVDENSYLRHKDCSLLLLANKKLIRCDQCIKVRNTLQKKAKRLKDRKSKQELLSVKKESLSEINLMPD